MFVGSYQPGKIKLRPGQRWFGLYPTPDGFQILQTTVHVQEDSLPESPDYPVRVTVDQHQKPIFLVRGIPNLAERRVITVFWGNFFPHPGTQSYLCLGDSLEYSFQARGEYRQLYGVQALVNYKLQFYQLGKQTILQTLAQFKQINLENPPSILWAGDLDNDGKLDFLLELGNHYAGSKKALYLSSLARRNNLVEDVAEFRTNAM
jgi:hypothetical protein